LHLAATTLLVALWPTACDTGTADPADGGRDGPPASTCTRDPALVAEAWNCRLDDHCPCGAHCELGRCVAACAADADCPGGRCDLFGRCRAAGDFDRIRALDPDGSIRVVLTTPLVRLGDPTVERAVRFRLDATEPTDVRVVVEPGLEVACGVEDAFGPECLLPDVPPREERAVRVRGTGALGAEAPVIRVFAGDDMATATITDEPVGGREPPAEDRLTPGLYEGTASLLSVGITAEGTSPSLPPPVAIQIPLRAQVFLTGTTGVVALEETLAPMRVLLPESGDRWIGSVTVAGPAAGTVDFPSLRYLEGDTAAGAAIQVLLEAPPADWAAAGESFRFDLETRFAGLLIGARAPKLRWSVHLARTGDLPPGATAPAVPADAVLDADMSPSRGLNRLRWEAAVANAVTPSASDVATMTPDAKRELLDTFGRVGDRGTLFACGLSSSAVNVLARFGLEDTWAITPPWGGERRAPSEFMGLGGPLLSRLAAPYALADLLATSAELVVGPGLSVRDLPCDVGFAPHRADFASPTCGVTAVNYVLGDIDFCAAMADAYGCEVATVSGQTMTVNVSVTFEDTGAGGATCVQTKSDIAVPGDVRRVCRLPLAPASCAEMAACWDGPTGTTRDSVRAPFLAADSLPVSGDLACASGTRAFAWDADVNAELPPGDPDRLGIRTLLEACTIDFARIAGAPPTGVLAYGDGLNALFDSNGCVDAARLVFSLGAAGDPDRQRALSPAAPVIPSASALFARLAQRWLGHHGLLAREAAEAARMADLLRRSGEVNVPPPVAEVLVESLEGWNLLLHPRFATPIAELPAAVLADPDYRPRVTGDPAPREPGQDQVLSLPVALVRTLEAQLSLVDRDLETAALRRDLTALGRSGQVLRYAGLLLPFLADLDHRALAYAAATGAPDPIWAGAFDAAAASADTRIARILTAARAVAFGENPLGISEQDLPLYFFGDESGANGRFVAISDFLIGTGPGDRFAWAPSLVQRAEDLFADARSSFLERLDRDVQVRRSEADLAAELDALRRDYGDRICNYCYRDDLACRDILDQWTDFDPNTCFIRYTDPVCQVDRAAFNALLKKEQVAFRMCLVGELRRRVGYKVGFLENDLNTIADRFDECDVTYPAACPDGGTRCVRGTLGGRTYVGPVTPDGLRAIHGVAGVDSRVAEDAANACLDRHPDLDPTLPSLDDLPRSPVSLHECYTGTIGEAMLALRAAVQDVEAARSELAEFQERYDIAMGSCLRQRVGADRLIAAQTEHAETMAVLRGAKQAADAIATSFAAVKDCGSSGGASEPWNYAIACPAAVGEGIAIVVAADLAVQMDTAQAQHDLLIAGLAAELAEAQCVNDAEMQLVGQRTAVLRIQRAAHDVEAAAYHLAEAKSSAATYFDEGLAALEAARNRYVAPLTHHLWLDETIDGFLRQMRLARRVVYLAVRAVEYETQQSLADRDSVLTAATPADLRRVLENLWTTAATRGVNGRRPTDLKVVLSLRRHLLQLADTSDQPEGWQSLTEIERFRMLLQSQRYAVHDRNGRYLGQRIPFDLSPLGAIELGQAQGIPVLAASDCAERLWSVNASILGSDHLFRGDSPSFTRIELLKNNSFFSQWCTDRGASSPFQTASVRPSRNLFRDPEYGTDVGSETFGTRGGDRDVESRARIEAYFNVPRAEFERDDYANGDTSELAARGLYGAYALFLPAEVLGLGGRDGLVLNEVEDILLRFDYVSVAR
jgi:hypothetical protein